MIALELALLRVLGLVERALGPLRTRLEERREARALAVLHASCGGFRPGEWVRVAKNECPSCAKDAPAGSVHRVRRFTTEAREYGEWVFDKPFLAFCCASGVALERASEPAEATT